MRKIIDSILVGSCVILLTAVSSDSQETEKKASKEPVITCTEKNDLTPIEINKVIERHNKERAHHKAPELVWDCKLAAMAQEWATRGIAEHRPDNFLGENIFISSHSAAKATQGVKQWIKEKERLEPGTMKCKPGKICLHYTQVIAAKTERLGCGINRNATGKWKLLMVCNYDPAGNMGMSLLTQTPVMLAGP